MVYKHMNSHELGRDTGLFAEIFKLEKRTLVGECGCCHGNTIGPCTQVSLSVDSEGAE